MMIKRSTILRWLREDDPVLLNELWQQADTLRHESVGDEVHLRGLVEISNYCVRSCTYCGLRVGHSQLPRYRLSETEILACAHQAVAFGCGTLVMQSGEDYGLEAGWLAELIRRIKAETPLAVTLSLGERHEHEFKLWRQAGADRYLLRFETSNRALYDRIHPPLPGRTSDRPAILKQLRGLGYEIGSGIMIGIPGQTYHDVADDIELFQTLDPDMIGAGPYLPHPDTPLGQNAAQLNAPAGLQVPNTEAMAYRAIALTRMACPKANIPSTTALATLNPDQGRELGLQRGANVVMPNLTPLKYRRLYEIYPAKACILESAENCQRCMMQRIATIGRIRGSGRGDSPSYRERMPVDGKRKQR